MTARLVALAALLALTPALASADSYWLGRQPNPDADEYVFDVPVSADLAAKLTCADPKGAKFKTGVSEFKWEVGGKAYRFYQNAISWDADRIDTGAFAYFRNNGVAADAWATTNPGAPGFKAVREILVAQKKARGANGWFEAQPILLRTEGKDNPKLKVDFDADVPFAVTRHPGEFDSSIGMVAPVKRPQIVAAAHKDTLFVAYQTWDRTKPTDKVVVTKVALKDVAAKKALAAVRVVPSGGTLVGFAVDDKGRDFVLSAKAESFPNNPQGDFVEKIAKTWRKDILTLHTEGKAADVGTEKFSQETVYGVGNAGSGRLAAGAGHLAAVFARRHYAPSDKLIHQEANDLLVSADLSRVPHKASNAVSHSFDQRLAFDGTDFVTLHQGDQYPVTGLVIEKLKTAGSGPNRRPAHFACYSCPTSGNAVFFELGGLAVEPDSYPVLFTATRNTGEVSPANIEAKGKLPWDVGMLIVRRDFDTKKPPANPFDAVGAGILADGYAEAEKFTFDNLSWDPAVSMFSKRESRTVTRRVKWLTDYTAATDTPTRASCAKLVQLEPGKYVAMWEESALGMRGWEYKRTMAMTLTITGKAKKEIVAGKPAPLTGDPRLHRGDDAIAIALGGRRVAAWVTAGDTNRQLALHTVDADLKHEVVGLALP